MYFGHMNRLCFLFFGCLILLNVQTSPAEVSESDVLKEKLTGQIPDSIRFQTLLKLSWILKNNSLDSANLCVNQAFELAQKNESNIQMAKCYYYYGIFGYYTGDMNSALAKLDSAIVYYPEDDAYGKASVYNLQGLIYSEQSNYQDALKSYLASLKLGRKTEDQYAISNPLHNIGNIHERIDNLDEALKYYKEALVIRRQIGDTTFINQSLVAIGGAYLSKHEFKEARSYLSKAILDLTKPRPYPDYRTWATAHSNFGLMLLEESKPDSALINFMLCTVAQKEMDDQFGLTISYLNMAECYLRLHQFKDAIAMAKLGLTFAREIGATREKSELFRILFECYREQNQLSKALAYQDSFVTLRDSVIDETKIKEISRLQIQFETERKEKELLLAQQKNVQTELKLSRRNNVILLISGGIIIAALAVLFVFIRIKQNEKIKLSNVRVQEKQKGMQNMLLAQENERKRISRELHDGIVQQLGGLKIGLQSHFNNHKSDDSNQYLDLLDQSTQELRTLSHQMMPKSLEEVGLVPTIQDMMDNLFTSSSINHSFEHFGITDRLPPSVESNYFRIAQELAYNAVKHSQASTFSLQVLKTGKLLIMICEDDGVGFEQNNPNAGIGLQNIQSRMEMLNGTVNFESTPKKGTLVTVKTSLE